MIAVGCQKPRLPSFAAWRLCERKKTRILGRADFELLHLREKKKSLARKDAETQRTWCGGRVEQI